MKKENKVTERALYASLFSMVLCCAMLLETTYAWFTQEITTGVAVIQTGEMSAALVVESVDENGVTYAKASDANLVFKAADITAVQAMAEGSGEQATVVTAFDMAKAAHTSGGDGITYFEPGGTYYLPPIYVMNTGNIDLKYTVAVSFKKEDDVAVASEEGSSLKSDLRDVIQFDVSLGNSEAEPVALETLDNSVVATAGEGIENVDGEDAVTTKKDAFNIYNGVLEASTGEEKNISDPIIIRATMPSDIESGYQNLKLENMKIIVYATQMIATEQ
ncbi:MAG: hypothetical protein IKK59_07350 [Lachnospiraceae bacterium]|nr:hypothetical protein [Lachnospiraceae bacterium]